MPDYVQPIAEALVHPPVYVLKPQLQPELLTGNGTLPRWAIGANGPRYGVFFTAVTIPPYLGHTIGPRPQYLLPLLTVTFINPLSNGFPVIVDQAEVHLLEQAFLFNNLVVLQIDFQVLPGCEFAFSYLIL